MTTLTPGRAAFHRLRIAAVEQLCDDAVAITFDVPAHLRELYAHGAGQSLTLRRLVEGRDERRSYSICSPAGAPPQIGVRSLPGGALSGWLAHEVTAGEEIEVAPPTGTFTPRLGEGGHHVLIAAGSGITPLLSIGSTLLEQDPAATVGLINGNRRAGSIMFVDAIAELKDSHPRRFQVIHVLSREAQEVELFTGRLDPERIEALLPLLDTDLTTHYWLCGPHAMVTGTVALLHRLGVPDEQIHRELFWVEPTPPRQRSHDEPPAGPGAAVTVVLDGRSTQVVVPDGETVLEAAQLVRPDLPFACKGGVCGTCRAKVTSGAVTMRRDFALEPAERDAGYVLTCQSECVTPDVVVDFDA